MNTKLLETAELADRLEGYKSPLPPDFVMPFGKYKGKTLGSISDENPGYIVWLAEEKILSIERKFLEAAKRDFHDFHTSTDRWAFRYE